MTKTTLVRGQGYREAKYNFPAEGQPLSDGCPFTVHLAVSCQLTVCRVTAFLEFLETCKGQGKGKSPGNVREFV